MLCESEDLVCFGHGVCSPVGEAGGCQCDLDWTGPACGDFVSSGFWRDIGLWVTHHARELFAAILGSLLAIFIALGVYLNHCRSATAVSKETEHIMGDQHDFAAPFLSAETHLMDPRLSQYDLAITQPRPIPVTRKLDLRSQGPGYDTFEDESPRTVGFSEVGLNEGRPSLDYYDSEYAYESESSLSNAQRQLELNSANRRVPPGFGRNYPASASPASAASLQQTREGSNLSIYLSPDAQQELGLGPSGSGRRSLLQSGSLGVRSNHAFSRYKPHERRKPRGVARATTLDQAASSYEVDTPMRSGAYLTDSD